MKAVLIMLAALLAGQAAAYGPAEGTGPHQNKFRPLYEILPTPTDIRTGSGAPGHRYWQQEASYRIAVELDEAKRSIKASATITYHNNSPDSLPYLWLQLEQNQYNPASDAILSTPARTDNKYTFDDIRRALAAPGFPGGYSIGKVTDGDGTALTHVITGSLMRVDLAAPLPPGQSTRLSLEWSYNIPDQTVLGGRSGYEYFPGDGNHIFTIGAWFPRLAAYTDLHGWHNKPFLGSSEFTLEFGDYEVAITVPADHIVAATGALQNPEAVLSDVQRQRLAAARTADKPVSIVTRDEAAQAERGKRPARKKTWIFKAENVRDFAFASSRKFIWDAWGHKQSDGSTVMAMSFYAKEGLPLWDKYATHAIVHALEQYASYTFPYPYPTAQAVMGPVYGMEYPMISFNSPRPEKDSEGRITYSRKTKYELISVIIHETGHNWFPMIVNSDERDWAWMDEGINSYLQFLAEQAWEKNYPSRRGHPRDIAAYMKRPDQVPVMTPADSVMHLGHNAYGKPAAALNILRETIIGRDLFDEAFREYARRWKFKRPLPADFFRSIEDASGFNLDWFWRGWFYSTDHVDIAIANVRRYRIDSKNPEIEKAAQRQAAAQRRSVTDQRNSDLRRRVDRYPELKDFYNETDEFTVTPQDQGDYQAYLAGLTEAEKAVLKREESFYVIEFENIGGLVMPIILDIRYADGSRENLRLPAEIWRRSPDRVAKFLVTKKEIAAITLDPDNETADADTANNHWPRKAVEESLELSKPKADRNMMKEFP